MDVVVGGRREFRVGESLVGGKREAGMVGRRVMVRFSFEKSEADLSGGAGYEGHQLQLGDADEREDATNPVST